MCFTCNNILSWIIFLPLIGSLAVFILPAPRVVALISTILTFLLSLNLWSNFDSSDYAYQFTEKFDWIHTLGINYNLGVDGISLSLVVLATFLMPIIVLGSYSISKNIKMYLISMLMLQTAMLGTLLSLDTFLFYVFWELMLAPMYFIIGIWGGKRKIYATVKFVLYTLFGSILMLVALIYVVWEFYKQTGQITFLLTDLLQTKLSFKEEFILFSAFALAFGIKVPLFPFHTWLPDAHVEAPTGGSVVLAGILLKMGLYGFIRFACPLFPRASEAMTPFIVGLAVVGIVYGALIAWRQVDIKKLVAYSSVSHLGYCVLGLFALNTMATTGSIFQMLSHGVTTGALFILVGILYDRKHTRLIADYGGLASKVPVFSFMFLLFTLGSIALPLTSGFIGEFMILLGSFKAFKIFTVIAVSGVVLGAVYMLTLYLKTIFGELDKDRNADLTDVNIREMFMLIPLLILMFFMGIYPKPFIKVIEPSVNNFISLVSERSEYLDQHDKSARASFNLNKALKDTYRDSKRKK